MRSKGLKNKSKYEIIYNMNKLTFGLILVSPLFFLSGCESVAEDARDTPIGGVVSGRTHDVEGYLDNVRERNKAEDRDVWRPASTDISGF